MFVLTPGSKMLTIAHMSALAITGLKQQTEGLNLSSVTPVEHRLSTVSCHFHLSQDNICGSPNESCLEITVPVGWALNSNNCLTNPKKGPSAPLLLQWMFSMYFKVPLSFASAKKMKCTDCLAKQSIWLDMLLVAGQHMGSVPCVQYRLAASRSAHGVCVQPSQSVLTRWAADGRVVNGLRAMCAIRGWQPADQHMVSVCSLASQFWPDELLMDSEQCVP